MMMTQLVKNRWHNRQASCDQRWSLPPEPCTRRFPPFLMAITNRPLTMRTGQGLTGFTVLHLHGDGNKTETTDDEDWTCPNWGH
ncbi:hypothetical protein CDAR_53051 [Caerostris darwini]|uniref:Uncharacterized protein n=1 Tax=Caerostris darwini TaxID=1538125 RepID=A0AAV4QU62_9ARAC|nr:hypothetical protein CDAR_53051 [Caerostris darwini]